MSHDPVEAAIADYLAFLEGEGPEPSLDHLSDDERRNVEELANLMVDGRGIDIYRSRPSLDALLAGTEFEDWLAPDGSTGLSLETIHGDITDALGESVESIIDAAAETEGIKSNVVIRSDGLRIRLQFRNDLTSGSDLTRMDPRSVASSVFGRFPETAALVVVIGDRDRSSVAIEPYDTEEFIGVPDGTLHPPRIARPVLPLRYTLRSLFDDLAPDLSIREIDQQGHEPVDLAEVIHGECDQARGTVVGEGNNARIGAKKETWGEFDDRGLLVELCQQAAAGDLPGAELERLIEDAVAA